MTDVIQHRGPDGYGFWTSEDNCLQLGHRRLSIIDLTEKGSQPMLYADNYVITFNGEIYNYIELIEQLRTEGYVFRTSTDTEVVMAAYDFWGVDCLTRFDGMFSFALYDIHNQELFCARDRFGEKPFHYYLDSQKLLFGSEMKSLLISGANRNIDDYSIYLFINMGLHEDPLDKTRTFFSKIKRLKPGHFFITKKGQEVVQKCYWKLNTEVNCDISFDNACNRFRELFTQSVFRRLRSDVEVGTSLSGGLDSSAVAVVMHNLIQKNQTQKCFSARFNDPRLDEGCYMQKIVEQTGIEQFITIPDEFGLIENLEKIMFHQEEPFGSASIFAQWEVFKLANKFGVTVLLDGQGADEVFAGYTHFFMPLFREIFHIQGKKSLNKTVADYEKNNVNVQKVKFDKMFYIESMHPELLRFFRTIKYKLLGSGAVSEINISLHNAFKRVPSPFLESMNLNETLAFYTTISGLDKLLRFADRSSMAHSREVRLPFLSHDLVDFVFSLPSSYKIHNGWTKALIRYGLQDSLPKEITWRKNKLGFQPPQDEWENSSVFRDYAGEMQKIAVEAGYISTKANICWNGLIIGLFLKMAKR